MDVRMPDGTIIKGVPEGTSKAEIMRKLDAMDRAGAARDVGTRLAGGQESRGMRGEEPPEVPFMNAFTRKAGQQFLDNALGVPDALATTGMHAGANLLPRPVADDQIIPDPLQAMSALIRTLSGGSLDPTAAAEQTRANLPKIGDRVLGLPDSNDIFAAADTVADVVTEGRDPRVAFGENLEAQKNIDIRNAEAAPVATELGEMAGDAATVMTGRLPIAKAVGRPAVAPPKDIPAGIRRLADRAINSKGVQSLARGAGRAAETGIEGAALAILDEGDPLEVAAYSAGTQVAGSLALTGAGGLVSGGVVKAGTKILMTAGSAMALIQLLKTSTPGGRDRILESAESGFEKVSYALAAGAIAGMAGMGRVRGNKFSEDLPKVADGLSAILRGGTESFIKEWASADDATAQEIETIYNALAKDPMVFGRAAGKRLSRAVSDPNVSVIKTVNKLMDVRSFRRAVNDL